MVVPYAVPVFGGYYGYGAYDYAPQQQPVTIVVPQQPAPQVIINHHYNSPDAVRPSVSTEVPGERGEVRVYEANPRKPVPEAAQEARTYVRDDKPNIYLIALKDSTVRQAIGYWAEGTSLHYVTPEASISRVSLDMVDREGTRQLNAQRGLELELPSAIQ
jgi:hypothetical protein